MFSTICKFLVLCVSWIRPLITYIAPTVSKLNKLFMVLNLLCNLFKKKPPVVIKPPATIVKTKTEKIEGTLYLIMEYSDGTIKKEVMSSSDPTGVGTFLNDINR
jgi:hypothetical protein